MIDRLYVQPGKVLLALRHFPMSDLHPFAFAAAEAATCAGPQGQFWNMHDLLFRNQDHLGRDDLQRAPASLWLEAQTFGVCLNGQATAHVEQDAGTGLRLGVNAAPTILISMIEDVRSVNVSRRVSGSVPIPELRKILDDLLDGGGHGRPSKAH